MNILLSKDRQHVDLVGEQWRGHCPVADLDRLIAFYAGLRDRRGGRFRRYYVETVEQLTAIKAELARGGS